MQYVQLREVSWHLESLPDFLWIAFMLGRRSDWRAVHSALDVIDRFVPEGPRVADGRLTGFELVPEDKRAEAWAALRSEAPHALPSQFVHGLGLYPSCPARWLIQDWLEWHDPDLSVGLPLFSSLVGDIADKGSVWSTRVRLMAMVRNGMHGKWRFSKDSIFEQVPRYPNRLTESEQRQLESAVRAGWMASFAGDADKYSSVREWPIAFWARSRELTPCKLPTRKREEILMMEAGGSIDPEPMLRLDSMRQIIQELDRLGEDLREIQQEVVADPTADEPNAVLLGFASRLYRLLYSFIERPSGWVPDVAGLHLRPLVDSRIVVGWLLVRDDPEIYAAYREHGLGRLKLLREHLKADLGEDLDDEGAELLEYLDARVNLERDEMFQTVNLGSYADVGPREMAVEAGLKREYDLHYAPLSSINHGEWPALREADTVLCREPLHVNHRLGAFSAPSRTISTAPALSALSLAKDGIAQVFEHFGRDVLPLFDDLERALDSALVEGEEESSEGTNASFDDPPGSRSGQGEARK